MTDSDQAVARAPRESTAHVRTLVAKAQQGDREALEELYLLHFDRIYSYLHMSVGNRHDAEDLTTQTFLKMLEATLADAKRGGLDTLVGDGLPMLELGAEEARVRRERLVEVRDGHAEMVDSARSHSPRCYRPRAVSRLSTCGSRERAERSFRVGAATGTRDEASQRRHTASRRRPIS